MGVKGLWKILKPVGRRVSVETLSGKILAVDASIWLIQFVKGSRDSDGNPLPNAHLAGTFRRLCKLLANRVRPVFVFDGGTPVLKRRTIMKRSEQRQGVEDRHRRVVQKLFLLHLERERLEKQDQILGRPVVPSALTNTFNSRTTAEDIKADIVGEASGHPQDNSLTEKIEEEEEDNDEDFDTLQYAISLSLSAAEKSEGKDIDSETEMARAVKMSLEGAQLSNHSLTFLFRALR